MRVGHLMVALLLVCSALSGVALAGEPPVPIEGKLYVGGSGDSGPYTYYLEGSSDNVVPAPPYGGMADVSPFEDRVLYGLGEGWDLEAPWNARNSIWTSNLDGSDAVDVTALAGVGGINCDPLWSPDAGQIAFKHCDPVTGVLPCSDWHVWVMNADGTGAHEVPCPHGQPECWSPNGYRLVCSTEVGTVIVDTDGTDLEVLPFQSQSVHWSRDGLKLAVSSSVRDIVDDQPGFWSYLYLVNPDGTDPQILVEQFITDADVEAHLQQFGLDGEHHDWWVSRVQWCIGPAWPHWSPRGDRIAFLAIRPFDPYGVRFEGQAEVWIYDVQTSDLTQISDDLNADTWLSWNGHNTFPEDPEVTVDNTTVTFDEVIGEGLTTIIRDDDPPDLPTGFGFASEYYEIRTTAEVTGPMSVCFTYRDEDIPSGAEETLAIYHYVEDGDYWQDITVSHDMEGNVICGQTDSLSLFGLAIAIPEGHFSDVPATGYGESGYFPYWAFWEIEACYDAGIVAGYPDGTYRPTLPVTRDQMAVYISRALAGGDEHVPTGPASATFSDVPTDHWAYRWVEYAVDNDIVQGYGDGTYRPDEQVDRGQMAVFIARAIVTPTDRPDLPSYTPPETATFSDVASDHWAYKYIEYIAQDSVAVSQGYGDGTYRPAVVVTRDQMAVYVQRAFQLPM